MLKMCGLVGPECLDSTVFDSTEAREVSRTACLPIRCSLEVLITLTKYSSNCCPVRYRILNKAKIIFTVENICAIDVRLDDWSRQ